MHKLLVFVLPLLLIPAGRVLIPAVRAQSQTEVENLPEAKGKDVVERVCSACHEPQTVSRFRKSKDDWSAVIDDMVTKGADASDADFETIIGYLAKCFGPPVNVNTAAADDLAKQLELSSKESDAIVQYRGGNGMFKAVDDLKKVPGLDFAKIEPVRYRLTF